MKAGVAGATGFIGTILLDLLKDDPSFEKVSVLSRRPIQLPPKFDVLVGDVPNLKLAQVDVAFCSLGTTIAVAGSKEAFYHVDHDLVVSFAKNAKASGAATFVLVSSVGADEVERDLEAIGFNSLIILRPSMLMGERKEFRLGELIGKGAMTLFNPLMVGPMAKYRGIEGTTVAKAMVRPAKENLKGVHILEGSSLHAFA